MVESISIEMDGPLARVVAGDSRPVAKLLTDRRASFGVGERASTGRWTERPLTAVRDGVLTFTAKLAWGSAAR